MFTGYRKEDDPEFNDLAARIADLVRKDCGVTAEVLINWGACLPEQSIYSATIDTEEDFIGYIVKKSGETITIERV